MMHKMLGGDAESFWLILLSRLAGALWVEMVSI